MCVCACMCACACVCVHECVCICVVSVHVCGMCDGQVSMYAYMRCVSLRCVRCRCVQCRCIWCRCVQCRCVRCRCIQCRCILCLCVYTRVGMMGSAYMHTIRTEIRVHRSRMYEVKCFVGHIYGASTKIFVRARVLVNEPLRII